MRPDQAREPLERFMSLVNVTDSCWLWKGKLSRGYGQFSVGSRTDNTRGLVYAHRFAYEAMVGQIPHRLTIDHLCRTRTCVNPDHMEVVTQGENVRRVARAITHCRRAGHAFTPENTYITPSSGARVCRQCKREAPKRVRR